MLDLLYFLTDEVSVPVRSQQSVRAWTDPLLCEGSACERGAVPLPARAFCRSREVESC